jgi:hypothetical protein
MGQSPRTPQVGGEAVLGGTVVQPAEHDLLLRGGKFGGPTGHRLGGQARRALLLEGGDPTAYAAGIDAQEVGNFLEGVAVLHTLHGEATAVLQDLG